MACIEYLIHEADVFEVGLFAEYSCDTIKEMNITDHHIHLHSGITAYHPVDDIYREIRSIRRLDESVRGVDMPVVAQGNEPTGPGTATPRRALIYDPWKIVPDAFSSVLAVTGEQISDVGTKGAALLDFSTQDPGTPLAVEYTPVDAEIITVNTGGGDGSTAEQIADAVWASVSRTLTDAAGVTPQDIIDIVEGVWTRSTREITNTAVSSLTALQEQQLQELWQVEGLDKDNPMTTTKTTRVVAAITQIFTGNRKTITTATRQ